MKVYITAPYPVRPKAIKLMRALELAGHEVTSRWLKQEDELSDTYATQDLQDVEAAEALLIYNPEGWGNIGTGGRHVELGYALALGKKILLMGERSNIFHHLATIKQIDDTQGFVKAVGAL